MLHAVERRATPRMATRFPLRYRILPVAGEGYHGARVVDLRLEGLRFQSAERVGRRASFILELLLPGQRPVHTFGRAAWVRERPDHGGFEVGGRFVEAGTIVRRALGRHLLAGAAGGPPAARRAPVS